MRLGLREIMRIFSIIVPLIVTGIFSYCAFFGGIFKQFSQPIDVSREIYREAKYDQDNNEYISAYYKYKNISKNYIAYDLVLFQQAKCASAIEDEQTAIKKLKIILKKYPDSKIASETSYNLGQAYLRYGQKENAKNQFLKTIELYPNTNFAKGSYYYLGEIYKEKNNKEKAFEYWMKYIASVPDGRFSADSIRGLNTLGKGYDDKQMLVIAIAYYSIKDYNNAIKYFKTLPTKDTWFYLGRIYQKKKDKSKALYYYGEGIKKYENQSRFRMYDAMQAYVKMSSYKKAYSWSKVVEYSKKYKDFPLYNKARALCDKQKKYQIYNSLVKKYPNSLYASESLWKVIWYNYTNKKYDEALKLANQHLIKYENTKATPKVIYWIAKIYEKKKNLNKALIYYDKLLDNYSDSYYAFRAYGRVRFIKNGKDPGWKTNVDNSLKAADKDMVIPYNYDKVLTMYGQKAAEFFVLKDYNILLKYTDKDPFIESWTRYYLGQLSKSIVIARNALKKIVPRPDEKDSRWKLAYPIHYGQKINHYAKVNNLDPLIVISLLKEESHFNPFAVSTSNARGLMQLLPGTARDIARWKGFGSVRSVHLFNPEINIKLGTAYLSYSKRILNNRTVLGVAGYNCGPAAVERWLNKYPAKDLDEFIEYIPYDQTRNYVKKVYRSYWNYKRIY